MTVLQSLHRRLTRAGAGMQQFRENIDAAIITPTKPELREFARGQVEFDSSEQRNGGSDRRSEIARPPFVGRQCGVQDDA